MRHDRLTRRVLLAGATVACLFPWRAMSAAGAWDLDALMRLLATRRNGAARFVEQRFVQTFDAPFSASGTLAFSAPDRLERRTLEPRAETMIAEGNQLTLTRAGRTRSLALDASPETLAIIEALRGTLTGNAPALSRHFQTTVSGNAGAWALELMPIQASLRGSLRSVHISGREAEVHTVEMTMSNGDRSVTTIEPIAASAAASSPR